MSQSDVDRFVADLKSNEELRTELSDKASGIGSVVEFAKDKGYDVTSEEAVAYIQAQAGQDLTDAQLDAIAGGKGHHHHHHSSTTTQTHTVQTTEQVTTVAEAVEVAVAAVAVVVET